MQALSLISEEQITAIKSHQLQDLVLFLKLITYFNFIIISLSPRDLSFFPFTEVSYIITALLGLTLNAYVVVLWSFVVLLWFLGCLIHNSYKERNTGLV